MGASTSCRASLWFGGVLLVTLLLGATFAPAAPSSTPKFPPLRKQCVIPYPAWAQPGAVARCTDLKMENDPSATVVYQGFSFEITPHVVQVGQRISFSYNLVEGTKFALVAGLEGFQGLPAGCLTPGHSDVPCRSYVAVNETGYCRQSGRFSSWPTHTAKGEAVCPPNTTFQPDYSYGKLYVTGLRGDPTPEPVDESYVAVVARGTPIAPEFTIDAAKRYDGEDHNGDQIVDYFPPTDETADPPLDPNVWIVTFALDGYPRSCTSGTTYAWTIREAEGGHVHRGRGCRFIAHLDRPGKFTATLAVSSAGGSSVSADEDFEIKDTLVVSMGDSFGSGEGVAQRATGGKYVWESARCHSSSESGFALAAARVAKKLEAEDKATQDLYHRLTFLHLACSGALAGPGITQSYQGIDPGDATTELPPQLTQMDRLVGKRLGDVDAIMLSAGGNDIGFSPIIHACANIPPADPNDCDSNHQFAHANARFKERLAKLVFQYGQIHKRLAALGDRAGVDLNSRLIITLYPDFMHDANGLPCSGPGLFKDFTPLRWNWAYGLLQQLNGAIRAAAKQYGWQVVATHVAAFHEHGYCSASSWMNSIADFVTTGAVGSPTGIFHPNRSGQEAYADAITPVLESILRHE